MKITFIGSSHGVPEPHRKCSGIMIETAGQVYFVDMGTPAIDALVKRGIPVDRVKGVFITHMHGDHTNGLVSFVDLINWYFTTADPVIVLPDTRAEGIIYDWISLNLDPPRRSYRFVQTQPGTVYDDGTLRVTAIATQHCANSHAYILEAEGKRVLCTGDLKHPSVDFPLSSPEQRVDLAICESAHFAATEYLPLLEKGMVDRLCITHYSPRFMKSVMELKEAMDSAGRPMTVATDDLEILL